MTVLNKDLALLAHLAIAFIVQNTEDSYGLSEESFATIKDISAKVLNNTALNNELSDDQLVDIFAEAFENLVEITESYNYIYKEATCN